MAGRILIAENVATNRIALQAKLSAAHYRVLPAASGSEALAIADAEKPDLILASTGLDDLDGAALIRALRSRPALAGLPVALIPISPPGAGRAADRIAALAAGADDVIDRSDGDGLLLARLRGLLRRHRNTQELQVHAGIARAPGLAEAPGTFHGRGRIAVVATGQDRAMALRAGLKPHCRHRITTLGTGDLLGAVATTPRTDVFLVSLADPETDDGPRIVAELRAASAARHGRIVVALPPGAEASAGVLLDTGADDVITGGPEPRELALRLCNQLRQKQAADGLRARLRDDLQAAVRDPLTGLHNRRYALPCLDRMIDTARADRPLVVMVADLDHFKRVNDTMGHAAGDHVLRRVGALLRENLRDRDLVARIGGEEFLIAIPDCDPEKARRTAGRLCRIIRRSPVQVAGSTEPVAITISIGVALARPGPDEARPEVEALMEQADRALYSAKAGGRNTVTLATRTAA